MKVTVVQSSELGACWSPTRFVGDCAECERVDKCKLPEATLGRLKVAEKKLTNAQAALAEHKKKVAKAAEDVAARREEIAKTHAAQEQEA